VATYLLGRFLFPPLGFVYAFVAGFSVNLMPKRPASHRTKQFGLVFGLLALHLGYNVLTFFHFATEPALLAVLVSCWLVHLCERPSDEAKRAPFVLRVGVLTGY